MMIMSFNFEFFVFLIQIFHSARDWEFIKKLRCNVFQGGFPTPLFGNLSREPLGVPPAPVGHSERSIEFSVTRIFAWQAFLDRVSHPSSLLSSCQVSIWSPRSSVVIQMVLVNLDIRLAIRAMCSTSCVGLTSIFRTLSCYDIVPLANLGGPPRISAVVSLEAM